MDAYWWSHHMFVWMWVFPFGFLAVCLFIVIAYLFRGPRWFYGRKNRRVLGEAAREILDRRYASGEIDREEYLQKRHDILDRAAA